MIRSHCLTAVCLFEAISGMTYGQTTIFSTDFDTGVPAEISGVTTTEFVQGYDGYGECTSFGGDFLRNTTGCPAQGTTLTLTGLPAHTSLDIRFLLAIIDTWDGQETCCGPDYFDVYVDGSLVFSASFKNSFGGGHPYSPPPGVLLVEKVQLGFRSTGTNDQDSAFDMGNEPAFRNIPHASSMLTVEWVASGGGWHHTCAGGDQDESWAIDNLEVILDAACKSSIYCDTNPNNAADIAIDTCDSSSSSIDVSLSNGPPGQFCYLLVGDGNGTVSQPPGAKGDLCVVGGTCLGRYDKDVGQIDSLGNFSTDIKNASSAPCAGGVSIVPGATWNFQYWHRQPMGQPATFSKAICLTFE